jgi:hypothetical protein
LNNSIFAAPDRKRQGEWAEVCFIAAAMRRGLVVSRPYGDSAHYDLLVDSRGRLSRVQVKSVRIAHKNAYRISCGRGMKYKRSYSSEEADFIAAYVIPHDTWYIIPVHEIFPRKTIRVCPQQPSTRLLEKYREAWHLLANPIDHKAELSS